MLDARDAWQMLNEAELVHSEATVLDAIARMAGEISAALKDKYPLILAVMGGSVYFAGNLIPKLRFPIEFDFIHASRYGDELTGGGITWRAAPRENVSGRVVLVLDDILDGGDTMFAIKERVLALGAVECLTAVLADKDNGMRKPILADFVGLVVPNRFVFGCGMDAHGAWRNLPAIYAKKDY
jgi:hypoxanthine phosphoribosyltransferase